MTSSAGRAKFNQAAREVGVIVMLLAAALAFHDIVFLMIEAIGSLF